MHGAYQNILERKQLVEVIEVTVGQFAFSVRELER